MLISIVVPSYNQGAYIRETLDSILSQDYRPIEVLVLDGGSTDDTVSVLQSYGPVPELQWWSEKDKGVVDAVNKGLARATGEVIAIQSSDDAYLPGAFTTIASVLAADPEVDLVYGDIESIDAQSRVTARTSLPPFDLAEYIGKVSFIPQPAAFFRATAMRAVGAWREDVSYAADAEFYLRIAARGKVKKIDHVLARYRYHEAQRDRAAVRIATDWAKAIEPWTHDADARIRRYARGGIWRVRHHYTARERWVRRTALAYRMLAANPALFRSLDKRELIPGWYALKARLSTLKRRIGFAPRRR